MAQPTKPPVTSVWASTATDNVTPTDSFIASGWPLSTTPPSRGRFNWLLNYLYNGIRYLCRRGISDYDAAETYMSNDKAVGPDGITYISLVDNNIAHTPASSPTQWQRWGFAQSEMFGIGQTRQVVTGSRALGTTYTNTTGKPITLHVNASGTAAGSAIGFFTDGTEGAVSVATAPAGAIGVSAVIAAGSTYAVISSGGATLVAWVEYR